MFAQHLAAPVPDIKIPRHRPTSSLVLQILQGQSLYKSGLKGLPKIIPSPCHPSQGRQVACSEYSPAFLRKFPQMLSALPKGMLSELWTPFHHLLALRFGDKLFHLTVSQFLHL